MQISIGFKKRTYMNERGYFFSIIGVHEQESVDFRERAKALDIQRPLSWKL